METTLDGSLGSTPSTFGPVDAADVCLRLDTRNNIQRGHFAAQTDAIAGADSGFTLVLVDSVGTTLQVGGEITVGFEFLRSHASLEFDLPVGAITDAVLEVRGHDGAVPTNIHVALFEPFESRSEETGGGNPIGSVNTVRGSARGIE